MSGRPSWKSAESGLFRPFSAFFAFFRRAQTAPGKSRKRRKKAFFLRYPLICLNPYLLNPHLRHSNSGSDFESLSDQFSHSCRSLWDRRPGSQIWMRLFCLQLEASYFQLSFFAYSGVVVERFLLTVGVFCLQLELSY